MAPRSTRRHSPRKDEEFATHHVTIPSPGENVPAILLRPPAAESVAAAVLVHGLSSRKERMASSIGTALARRGIASLSIDLPLHGAREGTPHDAGARNPMTLIAKWRLALSDVVGAVRHLRSLEGIDSDRVALVGYSLGAFLSVHVAAGEADVGALVLAAGGDLPNDQAFALFARSIADPVRAVKRLRGTPLLMINGHFDQAVTPSQAERLYAAAGEPKEIRWYQGGHWPPPGEIDFAAQWVAATLSGEEAA